MTSDGAADLEALNEAIEACRLRHFRQTLDQLAKLKASAIRELQVANDPAAMRRAFAVLSLVRGMRQHEIRLHRDELRSFERSQARRRMRRRIEAGEVTPEERRTWRAGLMKQIGEDLGTMSEKLPEALVHLEALRAR